MMARATIVRIAGISFWALVSALSARLLMMVSLLLAARHLPKEAYGSLALMLNTAQTWSVFLSGGISVTLSKFLSEYRQQSAQRGASLICTMTLCALGLASTLFFLAAGFSQEIGRRLFDGNLTGAEVVVTAGWIFVLTQYAALQGAVSGLEAYRENAVIAGLSGLLSLLLICCAVPPERDWILAALICGNVVGLAMTSLWVYRKIRSWHCSGWRLFSSAHMDLIVRFGMPAFVGALLVSQLQWHANLGVANGSGGFGELAGLNIALQWYAVIQFIPGVVSNSMLPLLSRLVAEGRAQAQSIRVAFTINALIVVLICAVTLLLSEPILRHYGADYVRHTDLLRCLAVAAAVSGATSIFLQQIASHGKGWWMLKINILWAVIFLLATLGFNLGGSGALQVAFGYLCANIGQAVAMIVAANKVGKVSMALCR